MQNHRASLDAMLAAWNEQDPSKIRAYLDVALSLDVYFVDPSIEITGIDAFEKMVHDVQRRLPGAVYSRVSEIDTHHNQHRYHWAIHVSDNLMVQGFDVTELRDGKVTRVVGFFGDLPITGSL